MALRSRQGSGRRPLAIVLAIGLFAGGIYLGTRLAEPPPRPHLPPEEEVIHEGHLDKKSRQDHGERPKAARPVVAEPRGAEPERQPPPQGRGGPRIAIVIDDLGRSVDAVDALLELGEPITFAVLPFESETPQVASRLREAGAEMILHLPMEARGKNNPGPGALLLAMSRAELQQGTRQALAAVPGAQGVNNHMGSALAADGEKMKAVLEVLKEEKLFFLDSRTAADTQGYTVARRLGLPAAERQMFLDNVRDTAAIITQLQELYNLARSRGGAIAIAHPYAETLSALRTELPRARAAGVEIVPLHQMLEGRPASN